MPLRDVLAPDSFDQIMYVNLLWVISIVIITRYYDTPLVRLESVVGTGLIMVWSVWGVFYRLERLRRERYESNQ